MMVLLNDLIFLLTNLFMIIDQFIILLLTLKFINLKTLTINQESIYILLYLYCDVITFMMMKNLI